MSRTVAGPLASIIICTYNRAECLRAAVDSAIAQRMPPGTFEVIVVDNGSTDGTRPMIRGYMDRVRYLHVPEPGLSRARNAGWRAARAPIVAMLDDDAIADSDWLEMLLTAFETVHPTPICVGGRVSPLWEAPRPAWLSDKLLGALTVADWSPVGKRIGDLTQEWLVGANLAVLKTELARHGGFPEELGRKGRALLSGEETYLQSRMLGEGAVLWYEPRAHVGHRVSADRLTPRWFYSRHLMQGVSDAIIWRFERRDGDESAFARFWTELVRGVRATAPLVTAGWRPVDARAVERACGALWHLGFLYGLSGLRLRG